MRIVYIVTRADAVGGASVHVREMARAMIERGHEAVALVGGTGPVTDELQKAGVPFQPLKLLGRPIHPVRDTLAFAELAETLRKLRPDLVSTHTAKAGWLGRAACARLSLPAIYTPHGWTVGDRISLTQGAVYRMAEKVAARWARAIVCVCAYERETALKNGIGTPERLHIVYNGVREVAPELRAEPARRPVRIVTVARFESPKDHETLLRALARMAPTEWRLELIGDGPLEPDIRRLVEDLGLAGRVEFSGYLPDPAPALARAQIFALSSTSEGFPRSVLEAMRAGLPVVASNVGGVSEAVKNGKNGLLASRRDPEALAFALARLISNPSERQLFGAEARRIYEARFRLDRMIQETMGVYKAVLEAERRG